MPPRTPLTIRTRRPASRPQSASVRRSAAGRVTPTSSPSAWNWSAHMRDTVVSVVGPMPSISVTPRSRAWAARPAHRCRGVTGSASPSWPSASGSTVASHTPASPAEAIPSTSVAYSRATASAPSGSVTCGAARSRLTNRPRSASSAATAIAESTVSPPTTRLTTSFARGARPRKPPTDSLRATAASASRITACRADGSGRGAPGSPGPPARRPRRPSPMRAARSAAGSGWSRRRRGTTR